MVGLNGPLNFSPASVYDSETRGLALKNMYTDSDHQIAQLAKQASRWGADTAVNRREAYY